MKIERYKLTLDSTETGKRIATARTRLGWSLQDLADRVAADRSYLWRIENGKAKLHAKMLRKIKAALQESR
jgi:ribosome-binding protein aMBF1 (putative translation factor)